MKKISICFFICFLVLLSGCSSYRIYISALNSVDNNGAKVFIAPADDKINENDLLYKEFEKDVKKALSRNGFIVVDKVDQADQVVFMLYGISDPKTRKVAIPIYGKTGISSSNSTGTMYFSGNTGTYSGTTSYNYDYGITGFTYYDEILYTKMLSLVAFDYKAFLETKKLVQLWNIEINNTNGSNDLRLVFPYMICAAEKYFGKNTGKIINVKIKAKDESVLEYQNN